MTEREAQEILSEIRTVRPRKRINRTLYELTPKGTIDVWQLSKSMKRAVFSHTITVPDPMLMHPDLAAWYIARAGSV